MGTLFDYSLCWSLGDAPIFVRKRGIQMELRITSLDFRIPTIIKSLAWRLGMIQSSENSWRKNDESNW